MYSCATYLKMSVILRSSRSHTTRAPRDVKRQHARWSSKFDNETGTSAYRLCIIKSLMLEGLWWLTASVCAAQRTFGHLALSHRPYFVPKGFWQSFKDYDGEPTNVREHQDAYEFFTRLQV